MTIKHLLAAVALTLAVSACATHKPASQTDTTTTVTTSPTVTANATLSAIAQHVGSWQTVRTGGNIKLTGGAKFSSSMQMRMVRDRSIYISLRPVMGIEVGRLVIDGDSIFIIDKVHRTIIAEQVSIITAGIPVTISMVQDMFLGRPFVAKDGSLTPKRTSLVTIDDYDDGGYIITPKKTPKEYRYSFIYDERRHIVALNVDPTDTRAGTYSLTYGDVKATTAGDIAHSMNLSTSIGKTPYQFMLRYDSMKWDEDLTIDTSLPNGYRRIDVRQLSTVFGD